MIWYNNKRKTPKRCRLGTALAFLSALLFLPQYTVGEALSREESFSSSLDFIDSYLGQDANGKVQTLWLTGDLKKRAAEILGHNFNGLRVRYWGENNRTLWVLDEIGKEMPITIGVIVENNKILNVQILDYRESRGGEIRYPFFTGQFKGLSLESEDRNQLDRHIDGITGATLSVSAVRKIAILALVFHQHTPYST